MGLVDISLTSAMRTTLFSLQNTSAKVERTQDRLATGKRVNTALDNPTNFFASQAHLNRAADLVGRKDGIMEAIKNGEAASVGLKALVSLIETAKGIANSAHSASPSDRSSLAGQFNQMLNQIDFLAGDSGYRGTNLLKGEDLTVNFNENGSSNLTIKGMDATSAALGIEKAASGPVQIGIGGDAGSNYILATYSGPTVPYAGNFSMTVNVPPNVDLTPTSLWDQTQLFNGGHLVRSVGGFGWGNDISSVTGDSKTISITASNSTVWPGGVNPPINNGDQFTVQIFPNETLERTFKTGADPSSITAVYLNGLEQAGNYSINSIGDIVFNPGQAPTTGQIVAVESTSIGELWPTDDTITTSEKQLETAMNTLRTNAATMSSTLSVIGVRKEFTDTIVANLETGADNQTLADMNEEGANMLMLQTRQNLGITSLSMAGQSAQAVMKLF